MSVSRPSAATEVVAATAAVAAAIAAGEALAVHGGWAAQVGGALVAIAFVGVPVAIARWRRIGGDLLAVDPPLARATLFGVAVAAVVLPPYALGFDLWHTEVLGRARAAPGSAVLAGVPEQLLIQLGAVALPEELFFRGYVLGRLRHSWPPTRRVGAVPFGRAHIAAAALFAAIHLVAVPSPFRLLVFFPGLLFGWVAERSGSAVAAAVLHALCNVALWLLQRCYT